MIDLTKKRHRLRIVVPAYPAFNIYSRIARRTTALGPVCVASSVNEMPGWDVEVVDENNLRRYGPQIRSGADHYFLQTQRPADVVGLYGGLTSTIPRLYEIAAFYKGKGVVTVAGGQHFADDKIAEALSSGIDYVVAGEAEETIKELLLAIEGKGQIAEVKGVAYLNGGGIVHTGKREPLTDFDRLPLPDFALVRYAKIDIYPVERIRGCGMDCEFCTVKSRPRCAYPERLLAHISCLVETRNARKFFIVDDLFGQQRHETIEFCGMLADYQKRIRKRLFTTVQIRLDKAEDPELLSAMRQAGIGAVAIGFESPIEQELKAMNKRVKAEDMLAMARVYRKFGFLVHGMFIFGYPAAEGVSFTMAAKDRVKRFRSFISKARLDTVQVLLPVPLPGTGLRARLERQGRVYPSSDVGWEYYDGNFPLFEPDEPMTAEQMQRAVRNIMGKFYRFRYMFLVALNIFSFPAMVFFLHNLRAGWNRWYRPWRNYLMRFGGWMTMRRWVSQFRRGNFPQKLHRAREHLKRDYHTE